MKIKMKEKTLKTICLILITLSIIFSVSFYCWSIKVKTEIYVMKTRIEILKDFSENTEMGRLIKSELIESVKEDIYNLIDY